MEKFVEQTLLYDFYGELLNEHQRNIYKDVIFDDLSLSEIADEYGISRQGVHDVVKRVNHSLSGYEEKLHLVEKFLSTKEKLYKIEKLTEQALSTNSDVLDKADVVRQIQRIVKEIIDDI